MNSVDCKLASVENVCPLDERVVLMGQPPVQEFIRTLKTRAIDGESLDESVAAEEWRRAHDHYRALQVKEAGAADNPALGDLPDGIAAQADSVLQSPEIRRGYALLPFRWAMVEIERLIAFQRLIDLHFVEALQRSVSKQPTDEQLLTLALGDGSAAMSAPILKQSEQLYSFTSPASGLRPIGTVLLDPARVRGTHPVGRIWAVVATFVGFPLNLISAVHIHNRLLLFNGYHRAYALRTLGVTHVPCLVRFASREEDLDLIAATDIRQNSQLYFKASRPPILRDFFDPPLRKIIRVPRTHHTLHVQVTAQQSRTPVAWTATPVHDVTIT
jgi:hypothetical protein